MNNYPYLFSCILTSVCCCTLQPQCLVLSVVMDNKRTITKMMNDWVLTSVSFKNSLDDLLLFLNPKNESVADN